MLAEGEKRHTATSATQILTTDERHRRATSTELAPTSALAAVLLAFNALSYAPLRQARGPTGFGFTGCFAAEGANEERAVLDVDGRVVIRVSGARGGARVLQVFDSKSITVHGQQW